MSSTTEWNAAWILLGVLTPPVGLLDQLVRAYSEPGRHYHNLRHLDECFGHLDSVRPHLQRPAEVALALWFHDAIYEPHRSDNESKSAAWAEQAIRDAGGPPSTAQAVRDLILATAHDVPPVLGDHRFLVDIDLAILGADATRFDEYEAEIREEYAWVAAEEFRSARARVLRRFLSRPSVYSTALFQQRFEARARENLQRSLRRLEV